MNSINIILIIVFIVTLGVIIYMFKSPNTINTIKQWILPDNSNDKNKEKSVKKKKKKYTSEIESYMSEISGLSGLSGISDVSISSQIGESDFETHIDL